MQSVFKKLIIVCTDGARVPVIRMIPPVFVASFLPS